MSAFWKYFTDTLRWPQIHAPGALQAVTRGLAGHLDATREDARYLRDQFFPAKAEDVILPAHGDSRGITRHSTETDAQFRARVVHAWRWHNLGGKTLGLPEILRFYGWDGVRFENMRHEAPHRWAEFSIGLQTPQNNNYDDILATLDTLIWLVNEYKPARSVLWRVYTDIFDRRPIVLANGPKLGEGWLSFYSGVSVPGGPGLPGLPDEDVIVSFGVRNGYQAEPYCPDSLAGSFATQTHFGFCAPYLDSFQLGRSTLGDRVIRNNPFVIGSFFSILWADRARSERSWQGGWDDRRWLDYTSYDRQLTPWRMGRRTTSRAQLVPGWGEPLSDNNARLGVTFAEIYSNPAKIGGFKLSEHDHERQTVRLHEMTIVTSGLAVPPLDPAPPGVARKEQMSVTRPDPNPERGQVAGADTLSTASVPLVLPDHPDHPDHPSPHAGRGEVLGTICTPPDLPAPSSAVTSYSAPLWLGSWADADRTWDSAQQISIQ